MTGWPSNASSDFWRHCDGGSPDLPGTPRLKKHPDCPDPTEKGPYGAVSGRYTELTGLLNSLVPDLETAARSVAEDQRAEAFDLLATTYQACSAALAKLGEPDVAWIAADRAMAAAERAGDPLLVAAGAYRLPVVVSTARHYGPAA